MGTSRHFRLSRVSQSFAPPMVFCFVILLNSEAHAPHPHFEEVIITYLAITVPLWIMFEVLHHVMTKDSSPAPKAVPRGN